jgi:hypothetical protein
MAKSTPNRQTSNKAGVVSTAKKLENSRYGFDTHPASRKTAGAFGQEKGDNPVRRKAGTAATREGKASALRRVK